MKLLITSVRNEAPYLAEWITWHKMLGFDHFLVYTNDNTDATKEVLEKISHLGFLTWIELFPSKEASPQMFAFKEALNWVHEKKPEWIALFDVDEFLNLKQDINLDLFLKRHESADAIAINWKIFGSSRLIKRGIGLTPERFLWSAQQDFLQHSQFKSIFKYNKDLIRFHHRAVYKGHVYKNLKYVFPDGTPLDDNILRPGKFTSEGKFYFDFSVAQLNHYAIRSIEEYKKKRMRGDGFNSLSKDMSFKDQSYLGRFNKNDVFDDTILVRLNEYVKEYINLCGQSDIPMFIS